MAHEFPDVITALTNLCRQYRVRCIVQVGAEDGWEAAEVARRLGDCRAVAIDADPGSGPHVSGGMEWHQMLIGATDSPQQPFYVHKERGLSSQLMRSDGKEERVLMPQRRLDTFCREQDHLAPDCLIIDTEGTTLDVLEGAGDLLSGVRVIYAEVSHDTSRGNRAMADAVDGHLVARGFARREDAPSYCAGSQSNWTWVRG